ncbi:MAG: hypothetical protein ACPGYT_12680 [Nitrospirales bacterium]
MKSLLENISSEWPPPPHDPRERKCIGHIDQWEARIFSQTESKHHYFAKRGLLHIQLWHPHLHISILTPSRLTANYYEIFPIQGNKISVCCLDTVNNLLHDFYQLSHLDPLTIRFTERYFVLAESLQAVIGKSIQESIPSANKDS